jgi:hypothetical protein
MKEKVVKLVKKRIPIERQIKRTSLLAAGKRKMIRKFK